MLPPTGAGVVSSPSAGRCQRQGGTPTRSIPLVVSFTPFWRRFDGFRGNNVSSVECGTSGRSPCAHLHSHRRPGPPIKEGILNLWRKKGEGNNERVDSSILGHWHFRDIDVPSEEEVDNGSGEEDCAKAIRQGSLCDES